MTINRTLFRIFALFLTKMNKKIIKVEGDYFISENNLFTVSL